MDKKTFEYGGYTFEPAGQFGDFLKNTTFKNICGCIYYIFSDCVADGDEPYNYDEFYKASGESSADVFRCVENGVCYVPCHNGLAIFDARDGDKGDELLRDYQNRRHAKEEQQSAIERQKLAEAMTLTEKQKEDVDRLKQAWQKCTDDGLRFAIISVYLYAFRTDRLVDYTTDMCTGMECADDFVEDSIGDVLFADDGLYAKAKD